MNFQKEINKRISIFTNLDEERIAAMHAIANQLTKAIKNGHKILTAGNGGSAANAQHITGDIVGRYKLERKGFASVSLTVDPSVMTAVANDYGFENVFARQVEGIGSNGDVLIVLSSSANSKNLIKAVDKAKEIGIYTIGILGNNGGSIGERLDACLAFPFKESDLVEETAMALFHMILMEVEINLVSKDKKEEL